MTDVQIGNWQHSKPEVKVEHGVVTAKRPVVARIGVDILQAGGNAIDAAVAMAFAIDVAEPPMTGIGGGGFMTVSLANGESYVVDFFPTAPGGATPDMYELTAGFKADKLGFTGIKDNANAVGPRSVGVPGAVAGPLLALERWGKFGREAVLAPAIKLAREGTEITWYETLHSANQLDILLRNPEAARLYLREGTKPLLAGQEKPNYLKLPELADTLEIIGREGAAGFYEGEIAEKVVAELQKGGCPITLDDLANYKALVKAPLKLPYLRTELLLLPGGTGGPTLAEIVNILEGWDLAELGNSSPAYLHLLIETCKLVLADRLAYLADELPGQPHKIPWREIASKEFAASRRPFIKERAAGIYEPGNPFVTAQSAGPGYQSSAESCTTYLSAWDAEGNSVALTQTLNGYYGSGVAVPGTGIVLNNAMVLFDPRPGQVNSIAPGKRPLSSMAHFIAREPGPGGRNLASAGAPGGRKIIDTVAQVLLNLLAFDMGAQEACESPFIDPNGEITLVDNRVVETTLKRLEEIGHKISPQTATVWPRLSANPNALKRHGSSLLGGSDIFTPSATAGY